MVSAPRTKVRRPIGDRVVGGAAALGDAAGVPPTFRIISYTDFALWYARYVHISSGGAHSISGGIVSSQSDGITTGEIPWFSNMSFRLGEAEANINLNSFM
jgi:hypothetical protein